MGKDGDRAVDAILLRGVPGVGDRGFRVLVDAYGSPRAVLEASPGDLEERCGASKVLCGAIGQAHRNRAQAQEQVRRAVDSGFAVLAYGSLEYPQRLTAIPDPPAVLHVAGDGTVLHRPGVAVVGSRRASTHGSRFAEHLARELVAAGYVVVSGLAQGIDAAAHRGALRGEGVTVAVFGCGLDTIYPRRNAELAEEVRRAGAWVSEFALGVEPSRFHFPRRNRVISGLSDGVVVVEASEKSGSLITASCALDQGREVFAVPGLPGSYGARGTHNLLRQGAKLVESVSDILAELAAVEARSQTAPEKAGPGAFQHLWAVLEDAPRHIDELAEAAGVEAAEAAAGYMELVLAGHAVEWEGKRYARA